MYDRQEKVKLRKNLQKKGLFYHFSWITIIFPANQIKFGINSNSISYQPTIHRTGFKFLT